MTDLVQWHIFFPVIPTIDVHGLEWKFDNWSPTTLDAMLVYSRGGLMDRLRGPSARPNARVWNNNVGSSVIG